MMGIHPKVIRSLDTLPSTGLLIFNSARCRHACRKELNITSTWTDHTSSFKAWLTIYDIDTHPPDHSTFYEFTPYCKFPATPLYYAALRGFHDLVEHLITKNPQDVNADGGYYMRPLVAALAGEHFQTAGLLRHNGADPDVHGRYGRIPLHAAAFSGNFEVVPILIEYDPADINARDGDGSTPLPLASRGHNFKDGSVLRLMLENGGPDINVQNQIGLTPLLWASFNGALEVVRLLLEHGADVEVEEQLWPYRIAGSSCGWGKT